MPAYLFWSFFPCVCNPPLADLCHMLTACQLPQPVQPFHFPTTLILLLFSDCLPCLVKACQPATLPLSAVNLLGGAAL